jgi:hypothetical protein
MLFWAVLKKISKKNDRVTLLRELIEWLAIDHVQKQLFLNSLEVLDWPALDMLYARIQTFVSTIEDKRSSSFQQKQSSTIKQVRDKESLEKEKEQNSFNILMDSI